MSLNFSVKVLVAEDSDFMQKLFIRHLTEMGFSDIVIAKNGANAIDKLEMQQFDLIISDWNMPEKDGLHLLQWVRKSDKYKDVKFIMATAQGDKEKQILAMKEGANSHIAKPFDTMQLQHAIEEAYNIVKDQSIDSGPRTTNGKVNLNIAHIQITDHLALGILKHQIEKGLVSPQYFNLTTRRIPGWNPIQRSLETGDIDAAFVLAPIAMDLFAYNVPIKMVSLAHKNGSIFVRSANHKPKEGETLKDVFKNTVVNIPHKMSIHNMLAHEYLSELGLKPGVPGKDVIDVTFEVVPPIKMPRAMMFNRNVSGFIVAEPIGSNTVSKGMAVTEFVSKNRWKDHPCCIVVFRDEITNKYPDAVEEFTSLLVKAGKFVETNPHESSMIALDFLDPDGKLGLRATVLEKILKDPEGILLNDLYPVIEDFDRIQRYMHEKMSIGKIINLEKFIDYRFIDSATKK